MMEAGGDGNIPLNLLEEGKTAVVDVIECGRKVACRMLSLGITPGVQVTMLQNLGRGSLIVLVRESCVALGRGEAQKILVSPQPQ